MREKILLKYKTKVLELTEKEIKNYESKLNSCEVSLRHLKEKQLKLLQEISDLELGESS